MKKYLSILLITFVFMKQPQDMNGGNPLQFIAVCGYEDLTNLVLLKKTVRFFRNIFRRMVVLCYTVHSMSLHLL